MSEREPITGELRGKMDTLGWYDEDGNIVFTTGGTPVSEIACLAINSKTFGELCDAIDAVHAGLERENEELRERLAVLDNRSESMHIGSATVTITDELRKCGYGFCGDTHDVVTAIADRIDAEHQKAEDEWKAKHGQMWLKGYSECHAELMEGHPVIAADLEKAGWVKLPVDADGEVIHIGDEMEYGRAHGRVIALMLSNYPKKLGGGLHWGIQLEGEQAPTALDLMFHHYHEPTVEDVLTKFGIDWEYEDNCEDRAALLAEYAAKLRLAGDAE